MAEVGHLHIEAPAATLDSTLPDVPSSATLLSRSRWQKVNFLMAHISGGELDVLRGARRLLGLTSQNDGTRTRLRTRARTPLVVLLQVYGPQVGLSLPGSYDAE